MEFKDLIVVRRSVRDYVSAADHEALVEIVKEAQQAPSWKNQQTARCYVVETPEILEDLREAALPPFNCGNSENAALIVTTYVKDNVGFSNGVPVNEIGNGWGAYDLGLHDAYLVLAASNAGYDTLIMGIRDAEVIREKLNVPDTEEVMSVIAVGKRGAAPVMRPRKELSEVVKFF